MKRHLLYYAIVLPLISFMFISCMDDYGKHTGDNDKHTGEIIKNAVKDVDGHFYDAVRLGTQVWMAENLKTTKYADGTPISKGTGVTDDVGHWYYPDDFPPYARTYGLLYNWKAVMRTSSSSSSNPSNVQGICPAGWHVPSDAEWTEMTDYVGSQTLYQCNSNSENIAKALASTTGWVVYGGECYVGDNQASNDVTGFSAVPAGSHYVISYNGFGNYAYFWSATENSCDNAYYRHISYADTRVIRWDADKLESYSVRCIRDN